MANYWLVKQEPVSFSFDAFAKEKTTAWTGVRNYQARNFLRSMQKADDVLYYHSGDEKQVVGFAKVSKTAFPDPTADDAAWVAVELTAGRKLKKPVTLAQVKADPKLANTLLVRNARISVMSLTKAEFDAIVKMGS